MNIKNFAISGLVLSLAASFFVSAVVSGSLFQIALVSAVTGLGISVLQTIFLNREEREAISVEIFADGFVGPFHSSMPLSGQTR